MNIIGIDVSKNKLDCAWIHYAHHDKFKFKVVPNSKGCRYLVIDFGTSKSPKSTRQRDSH